MHLQSYLEKGPKEPPNHFSYAIDKETQPGEGTWLLRSQHRLEANPGLKPRNTQYRAVRARLSCLINHKHKNWGILSPKAWPMDKWN